jgi:hypothetical protein
MRADRSTGLTKASPLLRAIFDANRGFWEGVKESAAGWSVDHYLVGPNLETDECVRSEGGRDRHIQRIPAPRHQYPPDPWLVIARVESVPAPSEIGLEPGRKVHRIVNRRYSDIAEITSAIARRDVHRSTQCNCKMGEIAADAPSLIECFPGRSGIARILIAERDVIVHEIADCLHSAPTRRSVSK